MEGLYRGFECDAQETRGLWIESLPIEVISNRHIVLSENSSASLATIWLARELLSVGYPTKKPKLLVYFFAGENCDANIRERLGDAEG
jgi:hypothetical protein